ncbi:Uncharacterized protein APZ42_014522 [Daphnia magna]|uniref:Uncharacterized protein n=1 Tax=Daphnia magna TaxID=35525 RepID=A0A0P6B3D9_9CRUS|nr:Uncharacterized protein APZ42_014522 [Daphnia magna]
MHDGERPEVEHGNKLSQANFYPHVDHREELGWLSKLDVLYRRCYLNATRQQNTALLFLNVIQHNYECWMMCVIVHAIKISSMVT